MGAEFQSPSLRGSGRFALRLSLAWGVKVSLSIPFIAGQWSLQERARKEAADRARFNPLHCGAVVASARQRASKGASHSGFNPLHCGAVVASIRCGSSGFYPH